MYKAHNALYDALATAELFLAISRELHPKGVHVGHFDLWRTVWVPGSYRLPLAMATPYLIAVPSFWM